MKAVNGKMVNGRRLESGLLPPVSGQDISLPFTIHHSPFPF